MIALNLKLFYKYTHLFVLVLFLIQSVSFQSVNLRTAACILHTHEVIIVWHLLVWFSTNRCGRNLLLHLMIICNYYLTIMLYESNQCEEIQRITDGKLLINLWCLVPPIELDSQGCPERNRTESQVRGTKSPKHSRNHPWLLCWPCGPLQLLITQQDNTHLYLPLLSPGQRGGQQITLWLS